MDLIKSIHRDNLGGAARRVIFLIVLISVGGFLAWNFMFKNENKSVVQSAEDEKFECKSNDKTLCKFITSWESPEQYRFTIKEISDGQTATSVYEYDFSNPTKIHSKTSDGTEKITIGNTVYTKAGDAWTSKTIQDLQVKSQQVSEYSPTPENTKPIKPDNYKKLGREACGSLWCYKYQVHDPKHIDMNQYIWFDDKDLKLRKLQYDYNGVTSEQYYEYVPIKISKPSPIRNS